MAAGAGRAKQTKKKGAANDAVEQLATAESDSRSSVARKPSVSSVSTSMSNPGSRATSPYSLSASNEILGMLQQPGGAVKLPSFRKKSTAASKSGEATSTVKSAAMSKKSSTSTTSSSIASTSGSSGKPKNKASASLQKKSKHGAGTATPPIEWTSSEGEQEADATVVVSGLDKGKGRAIGQDAPGNDLHNDKHPAGTTEPGRARSLHISTASSHQSAGDASVRRTSPAPAQSISRSAPPGRPPDQAERAYSPNPTLSNPPLAPPSETLQPSNRCSSPAIPALASEISDVKGVPAVDRAGSDDSEGSDQEDLIFSLDAQIQAALGNTAADTTRQPDATPVSSTSGLKLDVAKADDPAIANIPDSTIAAIGASDDGSDDDVFDFDKQLAAAMDGSGAPEAIEPEQLAPATSAVASEQLPAVAAPNTNSDSDDDDEEEAFDLDKALAAAVNPKGAEAPLVSQVPSAGVPAASQQPPAVSLDVASDDDSDNEVFDLDKELAAAIKPITNSGVASGTEGKESEDEEDMFDFDTHLAAALNATPSGNTALLSVEVDPALQALLVSPAPVTASLGTIGDDLPSSHLASGTLGSSSILQQVIPLPSPPRSQEDEDSDGGDETAFDLNAMLATAMTKEPEIKAEQDVAASLAADIQATLGQAFASAAVAAEIDSDSESSASGAESEDDNEDDVEMTFDLDSQLQAAMSGQLETWGDGDAAPVPGLDLNLQAPSFAQSNGVEGDEDSDSDVDEAAGFDLDAQIGAAMRSVSVDDSRQSSVVQPAVPLSTGPAQAGGLAQSELQNMLKGAMRQAALEIELDIDDLNEAEFDDLMDFDDDEDLLNGQGQGLYDHVPSRSRMRPEMKDNGNPTNAFNIARIANPQALHTYYPCEYPGCDRVYARMKNRDKHRATHNQDVSKHFACPHCPLRFATPQDSQEHLLTHNQTREWRYRCRGCHNLFGTKAMLDKHAFSAACQEVQTIETERCRKGIFTMAFRPLGKLYPTQFPAHPAQNHLQLPPAPPGPAYNAFFEKTRFDSGHLLAAALVSQLSTLIAQQYDRQNSLRVPTDPIINIPLAMSQTIKRANLTPKECAALASILATVGHARNEGLKASLAEARKVQIENLRRQHQHQDRIRAEITKRETDRQRIELERRAKVEQEKRDRAKARRDALIGDIPVPQAEIPQS